MLPGNMEWIDEKDRMFFYGSQRSATGEICYLKPLKDSVNLGFMHGAHLPDPGKLLQGTGKVLRHIKFKKMDEVTRPGLRELLQAALNHHHKPMGENA